MSQSPAAASAAAMVGGFLIFLSLVLEGEALTTTIIKPIRPTGKEIGLIFIPGAFVSADKYNDTVRAIQEACQQRVWVALSDGHFVGLVNGLTLEEAVESAMEELEAAGMETRNFVGVGHGWGGHYLEGYAVDSKLRAVILLGSTVSEDKELKDYPVPILTLAGELDGVTTITRVVEEYEKLTDDVTSFFKGIYRTPVILIEGSNHAQFASGNLDKDLQPYDLKANITEDEVHRIVAKHIKNFLTVTFGGDDFEVDQALEDLAEAFLTSAMKFQPFVDVRDMDSDGEESMWTVIAQEVFAEEYDDRVGIFNEIEEDSWFFGKEPEITVDGDGDLILGTYTKVKYGSENFNQLTSGNRSPREVAMKLVSKDQIWKLLDSHNDTSLRSEPNTCKTLNQLSLYLALGASTQAARERYLTYGRPIIFEEDTKRPFNFLWGASSFQMWEDDAGLHVKAVAMKTSRFHYCKVLPVYRAMEWVNVISLRPFAVQG